jgi:hypothetical protein
MKDKEQRGIFAVFMLLGWGIMISLGLILILNMLDSFIPYKEIRFFLFTIFLIIIAFRTDKYIKHIKEFNKK